VQSSSTERLNRMRVGTYAKQAPWTTAQSCNYRSNMTRKDSVRRDLRRLWAIGFRRIPWRESAPTTGQRRRAPPDAQAANSRPQYLNPPLSTTATSHRRLRRRLSTQNTGRHEALLPKRLRTSHPAHSLYTLRPSIGPPPTDLVPHTLMLVDVGLCHCRTALRYNTTGPLALYRSEFSNTHDIVRAMTDQSKLSHPASNRSPLNLKPLQARNGLSADHGDDRRPNL